MRHNDSSRNLDLSFFRIQYDTLALQKWSGLFLKRPAVHYPKRAIILQQAEPVTQLYYILSGFVEYVYTDPDGEEHLIDIMSAGNVCGLHSLFSEGKTALGSLLALTNVTVTAMPVEDVFYQLDKNTTLCREFLEELSRIAGALAMQSYSQSIHANRRIEQLLYIMAEAVSRQSPKPVSDNILIELSHFDLARICHTTRVTVTKALGIMKNLQLIDTSYGGIIIRNLEQMRTYVHRNLDI